MKDSIKVKKTPSPGQQMLINRLLSACDKGNISEATNLLDQGADINGQGPMTAQRPLISAAIGGHAHIVRLLIGRGADIDALVKSKYLVEYQDCSALMVACRHGYLECAQLLVGAGADVNLQSAKDDNNHPMAAAARGGHLEVVKFLMKSRARVTAYALRHAVKSHPEMVDLFLENGGTEYVRNDKTSLFASLAIGNRSTRRGDVLKRQIRIMKKLIAVGANISGRDDDPENGGCTPLVWSLKTESPELAILLINAGAEVNTQELWQGYSALHHAAEFGYKDVVTALLTAGADTGARNFAKKTPLELAENTGHRRIVTILKDWEIQKSGSRRLNGQFGGRLLGPSPAGVTSNSSNKISKPKSPNGVAGQYGASNFIEFVDAWGHPTWAVIAVESPVGPTVAAYSEISTLVKAWPNAPVRGARKNDNVMASLVPVVRPRNSHWSLVYPVLCRPWDDFEDLMRDAQVISTKLKSRVLAFMGHDTSGAMSYFLYDKGRKTGQRDWAYRSDPSESEFAELRLYVPACYPRQEGDDTWLAVMDSSAGRIDRADIIEIADC